VDALDWSETEKQHGKLIKIKGFPGSYKVKLFRVVLSPNSGDGAHRWIFPGRWDENQKAMVCAAFSL
jgi:RES domain-containing protein